MADDSASTVNGQGISAKAVEVGVTMAGKAYTWGGKTTDGFDCSRVRLVRAQPDVR